MSISINRLIHFLLCLALIPVCNGRESVFADYFDIAAGSPAGSEVFGKIHLERNKDVMSDPIPQSYHFEIAGPDATDFSIRTDFDRAGRITGVFSVKNGVKLPPTPTEYDFTAALFDGDTLIQEIPVKIRVVKQPLWHQLYKRYYPVAVKTPRLYGSSKMTDREVAEVITELEENHGRFAGEKCYTAHPSDYPGRISRHNHRLGGTIEYDWIKIANRIGGLGYAYATSAEYGPTGNPASRQKLRNALTDAILAYTLSVPIEGSDILIDGKPIGKYTGDGISLLQKHKLAGHQVLTHQWGLTDPLVVPALALMPELLEGLAANDAKSRELYDALIRYFQIATSIVDERRAIDNPDGRWGKISDINYSGGAWSDANLGHRSRTLLALPIIWADYNRPMTYVQYWYADFYGGKPFEGFSFSPGWSPHGVVADAAYWMSKNNVPTHKYAQSGFQPDGTVSHHTGHGTDAAMFSYGFEWLTDFNTGFQLFKGTRYEVPAKHLQFELDRLIDIYPVLFYKQGMDFLISGRAFLSDQNRFVTGNYDRAVTSLLRSVRHDTCLQRTGRLRSTLNKIRSNHHDMSITVPFWVNEYLVHRHGNDNGRKPFFASLKLKSQRTVGAEDFDLKVRHSWHMGSGILQLKVNGDEYAVHVLANFDWHALPGLTEEWRTDPLPLKGGAQASLPGDNKIAGVLADSVAGMAIYHHLPRETYSSATAFKSYGFIGDRIVAQGSGVARFRQGQGQNITTFMDQGALSSPLTLCINGKTTTVTPGESLNMSVTSGKPFWMHIGGKGYAVIPQKKTTVRIVTGDSINVTDRNLKTGVARQPGFIIALDHGKTPTPESDSYTYVMIPNAEAADMPQTVKDIAKELVFVKNGTKAHALMDKAGLTRQFAFFEPAGITLDNMTVEATQPSQLMLRDTGQAYVLSAGNPIPDDSVTQLTFITSQPLPAGTYRYTAGGIYPLEGETVSITPHGKGSKITVELPDSRDEKRYNYQTVLYSGMPVTVTIPKH